MYVVTFLSAVPAPDEEGGIQEVVAVLATSRHRTIAAAEARVRKGIRGEVTEWGETGWVPVGALSYSEGHPGRPILMATIEREDKLRGR